MAATCDDVSRVPRQLFVGEWRLMAASSTCRRRRRRPVSFEWLPGEHFLVQRWEVPVPEAPDGIAVIGCRPEREGTCSSTTSTPAASPASTRWAFRGRGLDAVAGRGGLLPAGLRPALHRHASVPTARRSPASGRSATTAATWEHDFDLTYTGIGRGYLVARLNRSHNCVARRSTPTRTASSDWADTGRRGARVRLTTSSGRSAPTSTGGGS